MAASSSYSSSSSSQVLPQSWQVFINFRGKELRGNFISHLEHALTQAGINYYIDTKETRSKDLSVIFKRIQQSQIALPIISRMYAESKWCLDELVEIMEQVKKEKLKIIPIFFNVTPEEVKGNGEFFNKVFEESRKSGSDLTKWENALKSVPSKMGLTLQRYDGNENLLIKQIVKSVKEVLADLPNVLSKEISLVSSVLKPNEKPSFEDEMKRRLKQLKEKINFTCPDTQIVGIVGMPGIGKTTLAEKYFNKKNSKFVCNMNISGIREESERQGSDWLKKKLLNGYKDGDEDGDKPEIFKRKSFVVLDDVSDKKQVDFLLRNFTRIKKGSKIVITTRDKSSIAEVVHDSYIVPEFNDTDASKLFKHHAFNDQASSMEGDFPRLTKRFVDYAGGNPQALEELGKELRGKDEAQWETRLETLPHRCNERILAELRISYDNLTDQQKDAFLDIACFFRSEEEDYVKCLLDPYENAVRDLAEKLFICISASRIEMHNLLCTFGKEVGSSDGNISGKRMWNHNEITSTLRSEGVTGNRKTDKETKKVRGIFLDTSKMLTGIPLGTETFIEKFNMKNLRYLKIYDSHCPQQCEGDRCKVFLPDGLEFPFQEIRYFHWLKFPRKELPPDFNTGNLIDLRLPHSEIQRVWESAKELPRLKWVDLSYSTKLYDLTALSKAFYLRRLNLEGCTILDKLPEEMKNMKSLVFLNLRGCVKLSALPENLDLIFLKTLILSGCSNFNNFELFSENLEFLHLDGTEIKSLPPTIHNFKKLVLLNLKNCKKLEFLPECIDKLKSLEELKLSGCEKLISFPDIKENMENLQILLLDGTSIKEVPNVLLHCASFSDQMVFQRPPHQLNGLSMLRRLCLSGNKKICSLGSSISYLYHLKWIDVRYCTNLTSLLTLPPNLQYLNAHACISLKTVASPLALLMPTEQVSSSFIFTSCEKLENAAKNEVICYAHNKSRLLSDALNRHNKGLAFETLVATCFPGSEVPAWFNHRASGAVLETELLPSDNGFVGIALCAIVTFQDYKIQNNNFMVKCICEFNKVETPSSFFNFHIGDLSEKKDEQRTINSTHVFIGFTSWLNINKCQEVGLEKGCVTTKASIRFEVTDGTCEAANCEVLKCGFSLVCESDNGSWGANVDASQHASQLVSISGSPSTNVHASPTDSNVSLDAIKVTPSSVAVEPRRGESSFFSFMRRRWFLTLR